MINQKLTKNEIESKIWIGTIIISQNNCCDTTYKQNAIHLICCLPDTNSISYWTLGPFTTRSQHYLELRGIRINPKVSWSLHTIFLGKAKCVLEFTSHRTKRSRILCSTKLHGFIKMCLMIPTNGTHNLVWYYYDI